MCLCIFVFVYFCVFGCWDGGTCCMAAGKNGELGCSSYWFWFWRRQQHWGHQHHHPPYHHHHASPSSSSTSASASSLSSSSSFLDTSWRPDLLEHMQCLGTIEMGSQTGSTCTVEGRKSRTCALLKCDRQRRARTRHQEEEVWCLVEERMLLLPVVPARHPKLADQFLPGTAASSLWSPEKEVPTMPKVVSAKPLGLTSPPSSEYWILAGGWQGQATDTQIWGEGEKFG